MNAQTTQINLLKPRDVDGQLVCPCGCDLVLDGASGSQDDTASCDRYVCDAGHRWADMTYTAWPQANGWYYLGEVSL